MRLVRWMTAAAMMAMAVPAGAQLLGGGGLGGGGLGSGLGSGLGGGLGNVTGGLLGTGANGQPGVIGGAVAGGLDYVGGFARDLSSADLLSLRRARLHDLIDTNRAVLDRDDQGNPIRRDEIIATDPSPAQIAKAAAAGFRVTRREAVDGLGLSIVVLAPPRGVAARKAIARLQALDPQGGYTLNPIYEPAFAALAPAGGAAAGGGSGGAALGLIDGGVASHPAFAGASIEQRGFAGAPRPSGHGTAVASLMIGQAGAFHGAAPGARLLAADVFCGSPANGSAEQIVRAMGWLAERGARVINISLVGPANPLLGAGVKALQAKGLLVVAAVGNDGPAAPPQYPASYPGVIAVTGVDARGRVLTEAGKAAHLDFAAPGADMAGAVPGGGWEALRGTSFAAPLVAASLARLDHGDGARALAALSDEAKPGKAMGRGLVCGGCATPPKAMGIK